MTSGSRWDGIIPHPGILAFAMVLYFLGFVLDASGRSLAYGFLTGDMVVHFSTFPGFREQFIDYLSATALWVFISNITQVTVFIFTLATVYPVLKIFILAGALLHNLLEGWGVRGLMIYAGTLHLHLEVTGCLLSLQAALVFVRSVLGAIQQRSPGPIVTALRENLAFLIPLIILLFAIAAILEVFWSTWWVYNLTHGPVSWTYFYTHVAAVEL
ncbi:hypothetical protein DNK57_04090 [Methanothermobacter thermautotrophicus]|uniref:Stage II sporulation protein M n=1 Tax=Methanothermobacter thermautotrophicus TaxID=145262 RepID=A0A842YM11_METTF|nr:hypothetical protein [Methanothermobacter thermautotrophicus]MBE2899997.1 hypothetical protein [Methanothermobacter thermautotrophicus]